MRIFILTLFLLLGVGCQKKIEDKSYMSLDGSTVPFRFSAPAEMVVEEEPIQEPKKEVVDRVYFEYDSYDIVGGDICEEYAQYFASEGVPGARLVVDGHCDERGTRDYNLGLGQRRAMAVKNALVAAGISASVISVRSFGKEKPLAWGSNEEAWALNRVAIIRMVV